MIIISLRNNICLEKDRVEAELLKYEGQELYREVHQLIVKVWRQNNANRVAKVSNTPYSQKGNRQVCGNYIGIALLNSAYKIVTKILTQRFNERAEKILGEYERGFRKGRPRVDQIFIFR